LCYCALSFLFIPLARYGKVLPYVFGLSRRQ
ncbi:MAG: hypothetical protein ACI9K8_000730, partial [Reinekea sp.]